MPMLVLKEDVAKWPGPLFNERPIADYSDTRELGRDVDWGKSTEVSLVILCMLDDTPNQE